MCTVVCKIERANGHYCIELAVWQDEMMDVSICFPCRRLPLSETPRSCLDGLLLEDSKPLHEGIVLNGDAEGLEETDLSPTFGIHTTCIRTVFQARLQSDFKPEVV